MNDDDIFLYVRPFRGQVDDNTWRNLRRKLTLHSMGHVIGGNRPEVWMGKWEIGYEKCENAIAK